MSVYGYEDVGMGYRYSRRARKAVIANPEAWARAAIYNKGVMNENPWVKHVKQKGVYQQISALLQEARKDYILLDPEKRKKILMRELENLRDEYVAIDENYPELKQEYKYKLRYDEAKKATLDRLMRRANAIANELGIQVPFKV
jgi:hypothetical protein